MRASHANMVVKITARLLKYLGFLKDKRKKNYCNPQLYILQISIFHAVSNSGKLHIAALLKAFVCTVLPIYVYDLLYLLYFCCGCLQES